jgi:hypothetical protein
MVCIKKGPYTCRSLVVTDTLKPFLGQFEFLFFGRAKQNGRKLERRTHGGSYSLKGPPAYLATRSSSNHAIRTPRLPN